MRTPEQAQTKAALVPGLDEAQKFRHSSSLPCLEHTYTHSHTHISHVCDEETIQRTRDNQDPKVDEERREASTASGGE